MTLSLTFHGAAGCVTGFCALLQTDHGRFLVDCGMFQGPKTLKALNHGDFPFEADSIDGVFLTHAHIDHSGLLPKLHRAGYRGPIYATRPTRDLCAVMLEDSAGIQEGDVAHLNRRNERRGLPRVEPIYTTADVEPTLRLFETVKFNETVEIVPGVTARYWPAGHLLGAASVELVIEDAGKPVRLLFSGDLGSGHQPFLPAPDGPVGVDHLVMESTYGDRERVDLDLPERRAALTEELILDLLAVMEAEPELAGEIYLDSPLAIEATDVFLQRGWNIDASENPYQVLRHAPRLHYLRRYQESDRLDQLRDWHVILAGSGMCDAGRIRKHLKRLLWRRETTLLLTGFQAAGTLGRLLMASPSQVRIQGDDVRVRARIRTLDVYSGHADASALVAWFQAREPVTGKVFLAHGEPDAVAALSGRLTVTGVAAGAIVAPELDQTFVLTRDTATLVEGEAARILPGAATRPDWYNARADLLSSMNEALQALPDDERRLAVIAAMKAALQNPSPAARKSPHDR